MIGDYTGEGTVGRDGEFKITLVELHGDRRWSLYPHLEVYGEGVGALRRGIDAGLLDVLHPPVNSRDEFARRLLAIGLIDRAPTTRCRRADRERLREGRSGPLSRLRRARPLQPPPGRHRRNGLDG
jgi:hypothetical protein